MNIHMKLAELKAKRQAIDKAIVALQRVKAEYGSSRKAAVSRANVPPKTSQKTA